MNRIEEIGGIHAAVFEDYRGRVPLLERKCGTPVNPSGRDLWVLCLDEDRARTILRYGQAGINEYVTSARANTFEAQIAMLPPEAAVVFARTNGDDDLLMLPMYPEVAGRGQRFIWRAGSYHLSAETAKMGRYMTRETRIGASCDDFSRFRASVAKASARLLKRAPPPFQDAQDIQIVSAAAGILLGGLREPGVRTLRHWLGLQGKGNDGRWLSLSAGAFSPDTVEGVEAIHLEYGHPRITSRICYHDGSVLSDLGLQLSQPLPDTVAHGARGMTIDAIADAAALGPWTIHEVDVAESGTFLGLLMPSVPVGAIEAPDPLGQAEADRLLAKMLMCDLRSLPATASIIAERDRSCGYDMDAPCRLKGGIEAMSTLSMLGSETAAFLLSQVLMDDEQTTIALDPWLGGGTLERRLDQIVVTGGETVDLIDTALMPGSIS